MKENKRLVYLDSHAHLYPCHNPATALEALAAHAERRCPGSRPAMVLLETREYPVFRRWRDGCEERFAPFPPLRTGKEGLWFDVSSPAGGEVRIYGGQQIRCAHRLEVSTLGVLTETDDGIGLKDAVRGVIDSGGLAILPWGAGKWIGPRAKQITEVLKAFDPPWLLLGDSSLRPRGWPLPAPMRAAAYAHRGILAGSDPLPRSADAGQVGGYASLIPAVNEEGTLPDATALCEALRAMPPAWNNVGKRCGPPDFLKRQASVFIKKKTANGS